MSLLKFEMKKMLKQKKYVWAFIVVLLIISAIFSLNTYQRSRLRNNWITYSAESEFAPLTAEWDKRESALIRLQGHRGLNDLEIKQLEYSRQIGESLNSIRRTIRFGSWDEIHGLQKNFLDNLQKYSEANGEFVELEGIEREIAIEKNAWVIEHDITYEVEGYPLTQHLFLKQISSLLLGIIGLGILLILFGNSIIEEKEHHTLHTLKTQPISKLKLILSKYTTFLLMTVTFIGMVVGIGFIVPLIFGGQTLNLMYPHVLITGDSFKIISTGEHLLRSFVLFFCASSITFSISLLASKWVKKSLSSYFLIGIAIATGYVTTSMIKSPLNPFYLLNFGKIITAVPQSTDWLYILSMVIWSSFFLMVTAYLPDQEIKAVQNIEKKVTEFINNKKPFASGNTKLRSSRIRNIISFEWRKVKREGLLKSFAIGILVIILGGHFLVSHHTRKAETDYLAELDWRAAVNREKYVQYKENLNYRVEAKKAFEESPIEDYASYLDSIRLLEEDIENWEEIVRTVGEELDMIEGAIIAYEQGDWATFHRYQQLENQRAFEATYPKNNNWGPRSETLHRFTKLVSINEKNWLIEKNIQPVLPGEFIPTIYQSWGDRTRIGWGGQEIQRYQWEKENRKIDNSGLFFLFLSFKYYSYFIPLIFLLFLIGGGMSKEKGKKATFRLLKTQPIAEENIFLGKVINAFTIVVASTLVIALSVVIVGTVLNRLGDWEYPVLHYNSWKTTISNGYTGLNAGQGYHFITLGKYLLDSMLLFMSLSILLVGVSTFLSLFFKRTLGVFALTIIIGTGGYWLNVKNPLQRSHTSPFTYFDIPKIVNGEIAATINDPRVNVQTGVIVFLGLTLLMLILGYLYLNKEKFFKVVARICSGLGSKRRQKNDISS